jgi:hypothetical protein
MATKNMHVEAAGFPDTPLKVGRNQDSVHFIQKGAGAPTTVTVPSTIFQGGVTTCIVDPDVHGTNLYSVVGADGDYTVTKPAGNTETQANGTIKVTG